MFYYEDGYDTMVGNAAKNLIIARDKYLEAFFEWQSTCLSGFNDIEVEINTMKNIMEKIEKTKTEEEKKAVTDMINRLKVENA